MLYNAVHSNEVSGVAWLFLKALSQCMFSGKLTIHRTSPTIREKLFSKDHFLTLIIVNFLPRLLHIFVYVLSGDLTKIGVVNYLH